MKKKRKKGKHDNKFENAINRKIKKLEQIETVCLCTPPSSSREPAEWSRAQTLENQIIQHLFLTSWKVNGGGGGKFKNKLIVTVPSLLSPLPPSPVKIREDERRKRSRTKSLFTWYWLAGRSTVHCCWMPRNLQRKCPRQNNRLHVVDFLDGQQRRRPDITSKINSYSTSVKVKGTGAQGQNNWTLVINFLRGQRRRRRQIKKNQGSLLLTSVKVTGGSGGKITKQKIHCCWVPGRSRAQVPKNKIIEY